ncbi:MAG: ABC transporter ATP-binding protein [Firmicutes bacterium]|nr:ABC transporter ATP-binding protein [Bacillota bacterium]MCL1953669.1 ABC transporter ATP-binding protein [Bacillota bacterium]
MCKLQLKNISKLYDNAIALIDINLRLDDNQIVCISGGYNSGKTTLLRLIAGIEHCSSGEILIDGTLQDCIPIKERDIAMIFDDTKLQNTVYKSIAFGLKLRKIDKKTIDNAINDIAKQFGLIEFLYMSTQKLDIVVRHKVSLARALVRNPKIVLLDNPYCTLSQEQRLEILQFVVDIQQKYKKLFVYATDNHNDCVGFANKIAVMRHGELQQYGSPQQLYVNPINAFVAQYTALPKIDFVQATISSNTQISTGDKTIDIFDNVSRWLPNLCGQQVLLGLRYKTNNLPNNFDVEQMHIFDSNSHNSLSALPFSNILHNACIRQGYLKCDNLSFFLKDDFWQRVVNFDYFENLDIVFGLTNILLNKSMGVGYVEIQATVKDIRQLERVVALYCKVNNTRIVVCVDTQDKFEIGQDILLNIDITNIDLYNLAGNKITSKFNLDKNQKSNLDNYTILSSSNKKSNFKFKCDILDIDVLGQQFIVEFSTSTSVGYARFGIKYLDNIGTKMILGTSKKLD